MSGSSVDISMPVLRQVVRDWAGSDADVAEYRPLDGGSINTTLLLVTQKGDRAVLKITPHRVDRRYEDEAAQLALLRKAGVPTPDVFGVHTGSLDAPYSYLLMEFVDGCDLNAAKGRCTPEQFDALQQDLAEVMLRLHATTGPHFMRVSVGDQPTYASWHAFYRDVFNPILKDVESSDILPIRQRKVLRKLHGRLDQVLVCDGPPRLLHWDVWATNLLAKQHDDGVWRIAVVLDPNCKFGCVEAELAYLDLFHTATPVFFKAYQHDRKLPTEYHQVRKPVYHLYSLLNHLRLFGQGHLKAVAAQIEHVAKLI